MIHRQVLLVALLLATSSQAFFIDRARPSRQAIRTYALSDHGPNKPGKLPIHHLDPHPTSSSVEHGVVGTAPAPTGKQDPDGVVEHGVIGVDHPILGDSQDPHGPVEHGLMADKAGRKPSLDAHPTSASVEHTLLHP